MAMGSLLKTACHGFLVAIAWAQMLYAAELTPSPIITPPGTYHTSWIGNSFGGSGAEGNEGIRFLSDGYGYWVQDNIGVMAVSPDGTVFANTVWDEGGRAIGLYKNGQPNRVPATALASSAKSPIPGFNTGGNAVCIDGDSFYLGNSGKGLLHFSWTPGDINSTNFIDNVMLPERPNGLSCGAGKILVSYPDQIELRDETSLQLIRSYPVNDVSAVLLAPDGSFWVIAGGEVRHLRPDGNDTGVTLSGIGNPISLAWSDNGALIVSDNGPAQQVLFFDVSDKPKLISTFGEKGGLSSGVPGAPAPQKLFALRGAGMDSEGNLYVGMSFAPQPSGNTFIRAFAPSGKLLWEDYATAFVDTFGFEPGSDGTVVYGRTTRWRLDLDRQTPGSEATLTAITLDPLHYPDDPRPKTPLSVHPKLIDGTQLLYGNGQYGQGYFIFAGSPGTDILHLVGRTPPTHGWAWDVTDDGDIWNGDAPQRMIDLYSLKSITNGQPVYDWQHPQTWRWPADFDHINGIIYDKASDSLYIVGYLKSQKSEEAPLTLGLTLRRYDGWLSGNPHIVWTNSALPVTLAIWGGKRTLLPGKSISLAGDYIFLGMLKDLPKKAIPTIEILDVHSGQVIGTLIGGPEIGSVGGWEDMVGSLQATKRKNGEYLILVEEDYRAKNILFRWTP